MAYTYEFPAPGVLLPPEENTDYHNPPPGPGNEAQYDRWTQAVAQDRAFRENNLRLDKYLREPVNNWWQSYDAGRKPVDEGPPKPPGELWVGTEYDDNGRWVQWTQVERPEFPVCEWIEDPKGWYVNGGFFARKPKPQH